MVKCRLLRVFRVIRAVVIHKRGLHNMKLGIEVDDTVDITDVSCPVTFVKVKVALE